MKQNFKIAVIGGTGKSGKYLVKQLLDRGYRIKLLLRNPVNFNNQDPLIEIIKGDARNYDSVYELINASGAVISTLGQPAGETSIFSQATKNIIMAMNECHVQRYIVTTGLNVDTPQDKKSPKTKFGTDWMKSNFPETTYDKQVEYDFLSESNIKWTLVRLPLIELTDEKGEININLEDCPGDKISATNLACFLVDQLTDDSYICKAPFIANV